MVHEEVGGIAEPRQERVRFPPLDRAVAHEHGLRRKGVLQPPPMLSEAFSVWKVVEDAVPTHAAARLVSRHNEQ